MRQRGFYSEVLDAEMTEEQVEHLKQEASRGSRMSSSQPRLAAPLQPLPLATQFEPDISDALQQAAERRAKLGMSKSRAEGGMLHSSAPSRALEPKVLVPFNPGPGKTPRKIVIERQKRLFGLQDLQQLLADLGIDLSVPQPPDPLPLELFDDSEFEMRPYAEWLSLAEEAPDGTRFLPAQFLLVDAEGKGRWTECQVQTFHEDTLRFEILWQDGPGAEVQSAQVVAHQSPPRHPATHQSRTPPPSSP